MQVSSFPFEMPDGWNIEDGPVSTKKQISDSDGEKVATIHFYQHFTYGGRNEEDKCRIS